MAYIVSVDYLYLKSHLLSAQVQPQSLWWRHGMDTISALLAPFVRASTGHRWIPITEDQLCGVSVLPLFPH